MDFSGGLRLWISTSFDLEVVELFSSENTVLFPRAFSLYVGLNALEQLFRFLLPSHLTFVRVSANVNTRSPEPLKPDPSSLGQDANLTPRISCGRGSEVGDTHGGEREASRTCPDVCAQVCMHARVHTHTLTHPFHLKWKLFRPVYFTQMSTSQVTKSQLEGVFENLPHWV